MTSRSSQLTVSQLSTHVGLGQRSLVAVVVAEIAPGWEVELHHDPLGTGSIVILPDEADDEAVPTLIIHANEASIQLDEWRSDTRRNLGKFHAWSDVLRAVRISLAWETPPSQTLH